MFKIRHAIELHNTCMDDPTILIGQGVGGVYALGEGICAVIDGLNCSVSKARCVYFGGGTLQMVSTVCLMGSSIVKNICLPIYYIFYWARFEL